MKSRDQPWRPQLQRQGAGAAPVVHALCEEPHLEHEQLKLLLGLLGQLLLLWLLTTVAGRSPELKSFQPGSPPTSAGSHLLECSADPELKALLCAIFNERYRTVHARAPGVLSSPFGLFVFIRGGSPLCTRLFLSFMLVWFLHFHSSFSGSFWNRAADMKMKTCFHAEDH